MFQIRYEEAEQLKEFSEQLKDMHSFEFAILGFPCEFNLYSHLLHRLPSH